MNINEGTGKFLFYLALAITLLIVVNKLFGKSQEETTGLDDLAKLAAKGIYPTFPDSAYESYANDFDSALDHSFGSQDVDMCKKIIGDMENEADMIKLNLAYGNRFHFSITGMGDYSMRQFVRKQLTGLLGGTGDIDALNDILKSKGITYRF